MIVKNLIIDFDGITGFGGSHELKYFYKISIFMSVDSDREKTNRSSSAKFETYISAQ